MAKEVNPFKEWGSLEENPHRGEPISDPTRYCRYIQNDEPEYNMEDFRKELCRMAKDLIQFGYKFTVTNLDDKQMDELKISYKLGINVYHFKTRTIEGLRKVDDNEWAIDTGYGWINLKKDGVNGTWGEVIE